MIEEKSADANFGGEYCRVNFRVRCECPMGQTVGVAGSTYRLGYFNKEKVVPLVTTPESYPVWYSAEPVVVPRMQLVHYKYCVMQSGAALAFESSPKERTFMPTDPNTVVEDSFEATNLEVTDTDVEASLLKELSSKTPFDSNTLDNLLHEGLLNKRMFIVCYHLPVVVRRTGDVNTPFAVEWGESLIAKSSTESTTATVADTLETFWLGTVSVAGPPLTAIETEHLTKALTAINCIPVFLDPVVARQAYHGYCKQVMWPILHNVDQLDYIHAAWNIKYATAPSGPGRRGSKNGHFADLDGPRKTPPMLSPTKVPSSEQEAAEAAAAALGYKFPSNNANSDSEEHEPETVKWNVGCTTDEPYRAFLSVNQSMCQSLIGLARTDDVIWVHDYHLMMLPKLIKDAALKVSIVFYMHVPFPTSQIFRSLPAANELLQSMTCADVVGFHAFDHARHFLNGAKRMLGIRSQTSQGSGGLISLKLPDREVIVSMSHVSIEPEQIDRAVKDPQVQAAAAALRAKYAGKKIIVGVDTCARLSGGALKLAAFEKLLTDYTNAMGSAVLVQRSIRSGANEDDEATTSADLTKLVDAINARYAASGAVEGGGADGGVLVDYVEVPKMSLNDRVALWLAADVFLLTCIREGLNLLPLEYIYARQHLESAGVVVASEFSCVSTLLSGALKVNPFYALHVADTLDKALCMTPKECNQRRQRDITFISTHPSAKWTKGILADLVMLKKQMRIEAAKDSLEDMLALARGGVEPLPVALDLDYITQCYDRAKGWGLSTVGTRAFVLDYGGTLLHKEKQDVYIKQTLSAISGRRPTDAMMRAVQRLSEDPHNAVMVVTGLTKLKMNGIFSDYENVTLATSNGLVYSWGRNLLTAEEWDEQQAARQRWEDTDHTVKLTRKHSIATGEMVKQWTAAGSSAAAVSSGEEVAISENGRVTLIVADEEELRGGRKWSCLDYNIDWVTVRNIALPIITRFTFRTNGTCMTPRIPGIGWSYFGADPDWSEKQAAQLKVDLEASLANYDVKVVSHIQGSIEVVPSQLNKGVMVTHFLRRLISKRAGRLPVFACVIGDEHSDDIMFEAMLDTIGDSHCPARLRDLRTFTVCVGRRETPADYYINEVTDVEHLLTKLADSTTTEVTAASQR